MTDARVVWTTMDDRQRADELARTLVDLRLAGCVQIVPQTQSIYRWQGAVEMAEEVLLIVKTTIVQLAVLKETIIKYHTYKCPEIIVFAVEESSSVYLDWLRDAVSGSN